MSGSVAGQSVTVVVPSSGNDFYVDFGHRLRGAIANTGRPVALVRSDDVVPAQRGAWAGHTALVVNPFECALRDPGQLGPLDVCAKTHAVLADAAGTRWVERQLDVSPGFDSFVDVGFLDQDIPGVGYQLLFNALSESEEQQTSKAEPGGRPISWSVIAHVTPERARLVDELTSRLGPAGLCFMPPLAPVRQGAGMLSAAAVRHALTRSDLYVWRSHHDRSYYESFRFIDAVRSGCVPCKIDVTAEHAHQDVPCVYTSVDELATDVIVAGVPEMFRRCLDWIRAKGSLEGRLDHVLAGTGGR